jgi:DNA polymerase III epsilon subunit-like protein
MNVITIDTETGGLFPSIHAVLSIGACCTMERFPFHGLITAESQIGKLVDPEAVKKNGYSREKWEAEGARPVGVVLREFLVWLKACKDECPDAVLVCHHLAFDKPFLEEATRLCCTEKLPHRNDWRCSQVLFGELMDRGLIERGSSSLNRLMKLSGFVGHRPEEHNALIDALVTKHGYLWLQEVARGGPEMKLLRTMGARIEELEGAEHNGFPKV